MNHIKCRICGNKNLEKFLSLGISPLANSFLREKDLGKKEPKFPLELCFCDGCKLVQLGYVVDPDIMFRDYLYVSSTSDTFKRHFASMAQQVVKKFGLDGNSLVVDIGSNDGLLLKSFKNFGVKAIGIEPAANISRIAEENGVETINDFLGEKSVKKILEARGKADVITACNVFAHIPDIDEVMKNVKMLLKENGIFIIEVQYFINTLQDMTFDNIYHEHLSYYTLTSLSNFFGRHGFDIFDVERVQTHGGSLRVFVRAAGSHVRTNDSVRKTLEQENDAGVNEIGTYYSFAKKVQQVRQNLVSCMEDLKRQEKIVAGYGAPAKSTTLLNFCGLDSSHIRYIVEDNSLKTGLYAPGTHIPVVALLELKKTPPDYIVILAWNFAGEIISKAKPIVKEGTRFIIPMPELKVV